MRHNLIVNSAQHLEDSVVPTHKLTRIGHSLCGTSACLLFLRKPVKCHLDLHDNEASLALDYCRHCCDLRWTRSSQEKSIASAEDTVLSFFVHKTFPQAGHEKLERPTCATVLHFEDLFGRRDLPGANPGIGHKAAGPWRADTNWQWFLPMMGIEARASSNI